MISTDGYGVSIYQIKSENYKDKKEYFKKIKPKKASNEEMDEADRCFEDLVKDGNKETRLFSSLTLDEKNRLFNYYSEEIEETTGNKLTEAELIDELVKHVVVFDPGKIRLLTGINKDGDIFKYNSRERRFRTGIKRNRKRRYKLLNQNKVVKETIEDFNENGKTTKYESFKRFVIEKVKIRNELKEHYEQMDYRKMRFQGYISTQVENERIVKKIKEIYGDNIIIGIGNGGQNGNNLKNTEPTIGIGLIRIIKKHFCHVFLIDEHRTSKVCSCCKDEVEYYTEITKQRTYTKGALYCHSLLVCKNKKCCKLWNRDINASKNILEIMEAEVRGKERAEYFKRKGSGQLTKLKRSSKNVRQKVLR
jgi:hypothetical protein